MHICAKPILHHIWGQLSNEFKFKLYRESFMALFLKLIRLFRFTTSKRVKNFLILVERGGSYQIAWFLNESKV